MKPELNGMPMTKQQRLCCTYCVHETQLQPISWDFLWRCKSWPLVWVQSTLPTRVVDKYCKFCSVVLHLCSPATSKLNTLVISLVAKWLVHLCSFAPIQHRRCGASVSVSEWRSTTRNVFYIAHRSRARDPNTVRVSFFFLYVRLLLYMPSYRYVNSNRARVNKRNEN